MIVTSDFECGNGKDIQQLGERHYRVTEVGDKVTYCYYFNVEIRTETPEEEGDVLIEVVGDPDLKSEDMKDVGTAGLIGHTPTRIYYLRWEAWRRLLPSRVEFTETAIRARVPVYHDDPSYVTNVIPATYTDSARFLQGLVDKCPEHAAMVDVGQSTEGRAFPAIRITENLDGKDKVPAVALSGEHPIEFPGVWGTRAIAEYLTSPLPEAAQYRRQFDVYVLPLVNPDGTVAGRNNFNTKGEEVYLSYGGAAEGEVPGPVEARVLWGFLDELRPEIMLNIHCYCGWARHLDPPYNGLYTMGKDVYGDPKRLKHQQVIEAFARFKTTGLSANSMPNTIREKSIQHQVALKHGTLGFLFEINAGTQGPWSCGREGISAFQALVDGYLAGR